MKSAQTRKYRVLLLTRFDLVPPSRAPRRRDTFVPWRTDYDVLRGLKKMGHDVRVLGLAGDLGPLRETLLNFRPDITYNLLDEFNGVSLFDSNVVSYMELMGTPYTGCNPRGLVLSRDKALSKKILTYHGISVPKFEVFPKRAKVHISKDQKFPLIVKSLIEQGSMGISKASLVTDAFKLKERIHFIHENLQTDAIVEEYISGRELTVGVMGNSDCEVFPIWEICFRKTASQCPNIVTERVKWDASYRKRNGICSKKARGLDKNQENKIQETCAAVYKILNLSGYARIDLRLSTEGELFVIEANPNPDIGREEEFADSALSMGWDYPHLLNKILDLGLEWQPTELRHQA